MIMRSPMTRNYTRPWRQFGLGDYPDYAAYVKPENCAAYTNPAEGLACTLRNESLYSTWITDPCSPHNVDYNNPSSIPAQCGGPAAANHPPTIDQPNTPVQSVPVVQTTTTAPASPAPSQPTTTVVNPSPASQSTTTGTAATSSTSAVSQANGTVSTGAIGGVLSTVQGYVSQLTGSTELISGVPNWVLLAGGGVLIWMMASSGGRR